MHGFSGLAETVREAALRGFASPDPSPETSRSKTMNAFCRETSRTKKPQSLDALEDRERRERPTVWTHGASGSLPPLTQNGIERVQAEKKTTQTKTIHPFRYHERSKSPWRY